MLSIRFVLKYAFLILLFSSALFIGGITQAALIHHYQAEGNANDSIGSHDGVEAGGVSYAASRPGLGQAFSFSGAADSNISTNQPTIPEAEDQDRSFAFWMKSNQDYTNGGLHVPFSQGHSNKGLTFQYGSWGANHLSYCCRHADEGQDGQGSSIDDYPADDLDWHHIAMTYNGSTFENTLYFDGVQVNTRALTGGPSYGAPESSWIGKATSNGNNLRFGTDDELSSRTFNGLLDDIRIFDHELSANEVQDVFNLVPITPTPDDLSIFWAEDKSGDWNVADHWSGVGAPPTFNQSAVFEDAISTLQTVFTNTDVTVNDVQFANTATYIVSGGGTVQITAGTSAALPNSGFTVALGEHQFQAAVQLNNDATANIANGSKLIFNNALHLNGNTLTQTGGGELAINNVLTNDGGAMQLQNGILSGHGTIGGDITNNGGTISPGSAEGVSSVPEPSTLLLLLFATSMAVRVRWKT